MVDSDRNVDDITQQCKNCVIVNNKSVNKLGLSCAKLSPSGGLKLEFEVEV